jgi:hypothetical protein
MCILRECRHQVNSFQHVRSTCVVVVIWMPSHQFHWNANLMKWKPTHYAPMFCHSESRDHDYCNGLHYGVRLDKNTWKDWHFDLDTHNHIISWSLLLLEFIIFGSIEFCPSFFSFKLECRCTGQHACELLFLKAIHVLLISGDIYLSRKYKAQLIEAIFMFCTPKSYYVVDPSRGLLHFVHKLCLV